MRMTENTLKINAYKNMIKTHEDKLSAMFIALGNGTMTSSELRTYGKLHALVERYRRMIKDLGGSVS